mgnify:FL=1|tara:strand:- start:868 stop:1551 length:684 start_codon:yes stop_codon:yes gene_type:complete
MKILSWNCNLKFKNKFELIELFNPEICVIQECENLNEDYFPNYKYFWTGENQDKGLGVLTKDRSSYVDKSHNRKLINFLPINSNNLFVLGVWAFNHRAVKFGDNFNGNTIDAINYYKNWLSLNNKVVIAGDFNNSVIWDKGNNPNNFKNINKELEDLNFKSNYHNFYKNAYGDEEMTTFYHTKDESKKYHIDYIYSKNLDIKDLTVGSYKDWIEFSDHVPILSSIYK